MPLNLENDHVVCRIANKLVQMIESAGGGVFNSSESTLSHGEHNDDIFVHLTFPESEIMISMSGTTTIVGITIGRTDLEAIKSFCILLNSDDEDGHGSEGSDGESSFYNYWIHGEENTIDISPIVNYASELMTK